MDAPNKPLQVHVIASRVAELGPISVGKLTSMRSAALFILFCTVNLLFRLAFSTYGDPCADMQRLDNQSAPFLAGGLLLQPWLPIVFLLPLSAVHALCGLGANVLYLTWFDVAFAAAVSVVAYHFLGRLARRLPVIRRLPAWVPYLSYSILLAASYYQI